MGCSVAPSPSPLLPLGKVRSIAWPHPLSPRRFVYRLGFSIVSYPTSSTSSILIFPHLFTFYSHPSPSHLSSSPHHYVIQFKYYLHWIIYTNQITNNNMRNKLTNKYIQHYYDSVLSGLITMDEFFELSMILPTKNLYKRNSQILNIL